MKRLSSAQFRRSYAREATPVEVTAYGSLIGTWFPAGIELPDIPEPPVTDEAEGPRFSIRPMKRARPTLASETVRVMDPLDVRSHELSRSDEIQPRVFKTRRV